MLILNSKYQIIIQISPLNPHPGGVPPGCVCAYSIRVGLTSYDYDYDYEYEYEYEYECDCDCHWVYECAVGFSIQMLSSLIRFA